MKKSILFLAIILGVVILGLTNCSKGDKKPASVVTPISDPMDDKVLVGEGNIDAADLTIKLYANEPLFVGYNNLSVMLYNKSTSEPVKNAEVKFLPKMDMGMVSHSCPVENPYESQPQNGVFKGNIIFIMESAGMGSWELKVEVDNLDNEKNGSATFDIDVIRKEETTLFSFISEVDGSPIFVTLIEPSNPFVGLNDFEITMHKRENMNSFPPFENAIIKMEPEMPTMGHGSPDNIDPVIIDNGHYRGKVNFTMPGYWKVNLNFKNVDGNILKNDQFFEITF